MTKIAFTLGLVCAADAGVGSNFPKAGVQYRNEIRYKFQTR